MTILVTGAAGYIGSHFTHRFLKKIDDENIVAIDDLSCGHKGLLPANLDNRVSFYKEDIGNFPAIQDILKKHKVDTVVHFASSIFVGESEKDPFTYYKNNVCNTIELLRCMNSVGVNNLVFSSSCAIYGAPEVLPLDENHKQAPISIYGQTKMMVEQVLEALYRTTPISYIALRYFNDAGAEENNTIGECHNPETHLIPNVLKALKGDLSEFAIYGNDYDTPDGTCIRDYVHINDLADAHMAAVSLLRSGSGRCNHGINLGTGIGASVKEIIDLCAKTSGKTARSKIFPRREGDPPILVADYQKAKELLGWTPVYSLERIIETAWNWEMLRKF